MSHFNKYRSSYLLYLIMEDKLRTYVDNRGGVSPRKTHFSAQKVDLGTDRHDWVFCPSHNHHI